MTRSERLRWLEGRPALVAIAAMNAITGLVAAWVLAPLSFGADVDFLRRGAQGFLGHYPVHDFVFTPLAAVLAVPLAWLAAPAASAAWSLVELAILLAGVALATRGMAALDRLLVGVAALGFLPVVNELLLGQVTMVIAAGLLPLAARDGRGRGVALGVVLALVPKPLLIPVLVWMLLWRRRALVEALVTAAALTLAGLLVAGPDAYRWWLEALVGAAEVTRRGNLALTALPTWAWAVGVTLTVLATGWAIVRSEPAGFVAALLAGLLLAPYTLLYALSVLLVGVRPAARVAGRATIILALVANVALIAASMVWGSAALASVAAAAARPERGSRIGTRPG